jgi:membrane protein implicated in regulation of membrane protease activity
MENGFFNQIKQELTQYGQSLGEVGQLRLVGLISRLLGLFLLIFTLVLCVLALFTFGAVALIDILAQYMAVWQAALIVGSAYVLLIVIAILCRRPLFIHPFIKLLTKQIKTEEELELKIIEAEHKADVQRVRMECQVENATREFDFYINLFSRVWDLIKGWLRK